MNHEMDGNDGVHIIPTILRPYSRGTVRLASSNPFQQAAIDPRYYSDQRDVRMILDGKIELFSKEFNHIRLDLLGFPLLGGYMDQLDS